MIKAEVDILQSDNFFSSLFFTEWEKQKKKFATFFLVTLVKLKLQEYKIHHIKVNFMQIFSIFLAKILKKIMIKDQDAQTCFSFVKHSPL